MHFSVLYGDDVHVVCVLYGDSVVCSMETDSVVCCIKTL